MRQEMSLSRRKRREFKADFKREEVGLTKVGDRTIGQLRRLAPALSSRRRLTRAQECASALTNLHSDCSEWQLMN